MSDLAAILSKMREDRDLHLIAAELAETVLRQQLELKKARDSAFEEIVVCLETAACHHKGCAAVARVRAWQRRHSSSL